MQPAFTRFTFTPPFGGMRYGRSMLPIIQRRDQALLKQDIRLPSAYRLDPFPWQFHCNRIVAVFNKKVMQKNSIDFNFSVFLISGPVFSVAFRLKLPLILP